MSILLVLVCGIPAAGKSCISVELSRLLHQSDHHHHHHHHPHHHENETNSPTTTTHSPLTTTIINQDQVWKRVREVARSPDANNCQHNSADRDQPSSSSSSSSSTPTTTTTTTTINSLFNRYEWHQANHITVEFVKGIIHLHSNSSSPTSSSSDHVLLLDDNFPLRSMRLPFARIARQCGVAFAQIHVRCDLQVAIKRNQARDNVTHDESANVSHLSDEELRLLDSIIQSSIDASGDRLKQTSDPTYSNNSSTCFSDNVSEDTVRRMYEQFESPVIQSNEVNSSHGANSIPKWWEKNSIAIDTTNINLADPSSVVPLLPISWLLDSFTRGVLPPPLDTESEHARVEAARLITMNNIQHSLDLYTRKVINQLIQEAKSNQPTNSSASPASSSSASSVRESAERLNRLRRDFLLRCKKQDSEEYKLIHHVVDNQVEEDMIESKEDNLSLHSTALNPVNSSSLPNSLLPIARKFEDSLTASN